MKAKILLFSLLTISSSIAIGQNDNDNFLVSAKGQQGWGFINLKGEWVIKPQYQSVGEFASNGLANVDVDYDKLDSLTRQGKWLLNLSLKELGNFQTDWLVYMKTENVVLLTKQAK